jgi:hypothetical protein
MTDKDLNPNTEIAEVKDAIKVILSDKSSYRTSLNYAINYCKEALDLTGGELKVLCLYILNNITRWRHPQAKEVRIILKNFSKRKF